MKTILFLLLFPLLSYSQTRVAVFGTSIEFGIGVPLDSSWANMFGAYLSGMGIGFKNYGHPNGTYNKSISTIWREIKYLKEEEFDLIILGGPTNDACMFPFADTVYHKFESNLVNMLDSIQLWRPEAEIIMLTAIPVRRVGLFSQARLDTINRIFIKQADLHGFRLCNSSQLPARMVLSTDQIHPNIKGHKYIFNHFLPWYLDKPVGNDFETDKEPAFEYGGRFFNKTINIAE